jgi:hypothetical protein
MWMTQDSFYTLYDGRRVEASMLTKLALDVFVFLLFDIAPELPFAFA